VFFKSFNPTCNNYIGWSRERYHIYQVYLPNILTLRQPVLRDYFERFFPYGRRLKNDGAPSWSHITSFIGTDGMFSYIFNIVFIKTDINFGKVKPPAG